MNDLTQISYKILFLAMLAALVGMSMPAAAQDPGTVGGPGAPTAFEGRGAVAPLPVPDGAAGRDESPADEVRSLPGDPEAATNPANSSESRPVDTVNPDVMEPASGPDSGQPEAEKPWWRFW